MTAPGGQRSRLVLGTIALGVFIAISAVLVTRSGSSATTARLPHVSDADFASANLTIKSASSETKTSETEARAAATENNDETKILDTELVTVEGGGRFTKPTLFWAVSLDPQTNPGPPGTGDIVPAGPMKTKFNIVFVDPETGEFVFRWSMSEPIDATAAPE